MANEIMKTKAKKIVSQHINGWLKGKTMAQANGGDKSREETAKNNHDNI